MTDALDKDLDEILEAAASWHARLELGTADLVAFELWRAADRRHAAAFARMVGTDAAMAEVKHHIAGEVDEFEVVRTNPSRRQWLSGLLVGIGALAIGGGGTLALINRRVHAETPIGGQVDISLPDDGIVTLNTDSRASWHFDKRVREIWLERGELALVAPVESRPWRISRRRAHHLGPGRKFKCPTAAGRAYRLPC